MKLIQKMNAKIVGLFGMVGMLFMAMAHDAEAAIDLTGVSFPLTEIEAIAALLIVFVSGVWIVGKVIGFAGGARK